MMGAGAGVFNPGADGLWQTFRGLYVRTHPDADVEAKKVMLVHADEIVFDDGTHALDVNQLVADVSASGAGGLDTGSEGASRWYEFYAIRKSSDGTLNGLLHRAKDWTSDASFTTARDVSLPLRLATLTTTDNLAQGIQFASSKPFQFVNVELLRAGAVSGNVWFTLESDSSGSPSGTVLATSDKINAAVISTSSQILRLIFRTPYTVTASTQYHLRMWGDYTRSDTVNIAWRGVVAGGYSGGSAKSYNGTVWAGAAGLGDFYFNAFCEFNVAAVTMPTGYDQKCKVGYVYNDSGSNFIKFLQMDRTVSFEQISLASGIGTNDTLTDLSAKIPPTSGRGLVFAQPSATGVYACASPQPGSAINGRFSIPGATFGELGTSMVEIFMPDAYFDYQYIYLTAINGGTCDFYLKTFTW